MPESIAQQMVKKGKEGSNYRIIDGVVYGRSPSIWFTNMDNPKCHGHLPLYKKYSRSEYPKFDNYDAIEVSKVGEIPVDYAGVMSVPISFLDKYNPHQFQVLGLAAGNIRGLAGISTKTGKYGPYMNGKLKYGRIFYPRVFVPLMKASGVPAITFHSLRHTANTLCSPRTSARTSLLSAWVTRRPK